MQTIILCKMRANDSDFWTLYILKKKVGKYIIIIVLLSTFFFFQTFSEGEGIQIYKTDAKFTQRMRSC